MWRSWLAHLVWDQRVESSSLFTPTIRKDNILSNKHLQICRCLLFTIPAGARRLRQHPYIVLADNGFRDYYKPPADIFDAVAAGRVLLLSPWEYDAGKRHISRADCVALNAMAEEIAAI